LKIVADVIDTKVKQISFYLLNKEGYTIVIVVITVTEVPL